MQAHEDSAFWLVFQVTRVDADISDSQHGGSEGECGDRRTLCSSPALLVFYFTQATANRLGELRSCRVYVGMYVYPSFVLQLQVWKTACHLLWTLDEMQTTARGCVILRFSRP